MRTDRTILLLVVVEIILGTFLSVGIGYAVEKDGTLKITDNIILDSEQKDFKVAFFGQANYIGDGVAIVNVTGERAATMDISGLNNVGDEVTTIFTIANTSNDIYADIYASVTNTNTEYFNVTAILSESELEPKTGKTILKVKTELIKLPIYKEETDISINICAKPNYK